MSHKQRIGREAWAGGLGARCAARTATPFTVAVSATLLLGCPSSRADQFQQPDIQNPPWAAPHVPPGPRRVTRAHGATLRISNPGHIVSGQKVRCRITVINHGNRFVLIPGLVSSWRNFPGTWCWGPGNRFATRMLRFVRGGYRRPLPGSEMRSGALPGQSYNAGQANFSHIFDLTIPGRYEAQLAGMGMISNVITFRVLPPNNKPTGPAIMLRGGPAPKFVISWGPARHGIQLAAYAKLNPNGSRRVRVHLFFRNVAHNARTIRLTGNPEVDFAKCRVVGPCFGNVRLGPLYSRINNQPAPLTAYGKLMVKRNWGHPERRIYTLQPGRLCEYWRPLLLNRRFDVSVYGPYRFSARLAGTRLKTGTLTIYVGVQPREYNMPLFNRWLTAWKKKHGVE